MSVRITDLLDDFSIEMTGKDTPGLVKARPLLPPGTRVNVTYLAHEDLAMRIAAAKAVRDAGLIPVPHISARRIPSEAVLSAFLEALRGAGATDNVFVIAGDPADSTGPYEGALALIRSAPLAEYGVSTVSISGYPEGHPDLPADILWEALEAKAAAVTELGQAGDIITQFGFDVDPVVEWIEQVRLRDISLPVRVGVPGPAGIRRLLSFAARFGVGSSATIARKYGFSMTNLLGTAGPDRFIEDLAARLDSDRHGTVRLHFYTFGGLSTTAEWVREFVASHADDPTSYFGATTSGT